MSVKDSLGESKKFLLLSIALLILCIIVVISVRGGVFTPVQTLVEERETYSKPNYVLEEGVDYQIEITTIYGEIYIDLYEELAPENVNSMLFLIGERYYENLVFHKVIEDFVIQAGDTKGDGSGTPGYSVSKENLITFQEYDVGMANASQFFIVLPNSPKDSFTGEYPVVGKVTKGFAVVGSIQKVEVDDSYRPINDVVINSIQIYQE